MTHLFLALNRRLYRQRFIDAFDRGFGWFSKATVRIGAAWLAWAAIERMLG